LAAGLVHPPELGALADLLARLRGMPPAVPVRGTLAEILNAARVANPNPSVTPSTAMVGVRG
jgi:hypothetical protein